MKKFKIVVDDAQAFGHCGGMTNEIKEMVEAVKAAKAAAAFWHGVRVYGSKACALRAYDCYTVEEAISMLAVVQKFSIFKRDGRVCVA